MHRSQTAARQPPVPTRSMPMLAHLFLTLAGAALGGCEAAPLALTSCAAWVAQEAGGDAAPPPLGGQPLTSEGRSKLRTSLTLFAATLGVLLLLLIIVWLTLLARWIGRGRQVAERAGERRPKTVMGDLWFEQPPPKVGGGGGANGPRSEDG